MSLRPAGAGPPLSRTHWPGPLLTRVIPRLPLSPDEDPERVGAALQELSKGAEFVPVNDVVKHPEGATVTNQVRHVPVVALVLDQLEVVVHIALPGMTEPSCRRRTWPKDIGPCGHEQHDEQPEQDEMVVAPAARAIPGPRGGRLAGDGLRSGLGLVQSSPSSATTGRDHRSGPACRLDIASVRGWASAPAFEGVHAKRPQPGPIGCLPAVPGARMLNATKVPCRPAWVHPIRLSATLAAATLLHLWDTAHLTLQLKDVTSKDAHGRVEFRTLKAVTVHHFGFPHAAQVLQVTRKTHDLRTRRWRTVTASMRSPASPRPGQPRSPRRSAASALGDRERPALRPRHRLRRGRRPAPHRRRPLRSPWVK